MAMPPPNQRACIRVGLGRTVVCTGAPLSPTPTPRGPSGARRLLWLVLASLPGVLALLAPRLADLLPQDQVEGWMVAAILWQSPPWLGAIWALWALVVALRARLLLVGLIFAGAGLSMVGQPLQLLHPDVAGPGLNVLAANVNAFSPMDSPADLHALEAMLAARGADVVLIIEKRPETLPGYRRVAHNLDADLPRESHGAVLFCKLGLSCAAEVTPEFGSETSRMPLGLLRVQGPLKAPICLGALHAPPPVPLDPTGHLPHVQAIAERVVQGRLVADWGPCKAGDPVVLAGDLNEPPGGPAWRLLQGSGLRDGLAGAGLFAASWPGGGGWLNLPFFQLDHVLAGPVGLAGLRQVEVPGSDHRGLQFRVLDPAP